eukprot:CAMPEP_0201507484 /NCGR_PEP_ID=MMETSP0161_2-20130828/1136_1 /ASSEMBLY_ACC=CAM_ASM_000251 /TAXON_ID=180227 /ORGANISM="Neoparamoeba aestuarina, Strain SoJaBio B1-5/56/2" /LENGTH=322 /DNA_ID=CAMNT_0047901863 /DNA_START=103 /DNA_END=1068 /DNA_ORIENTATION=-
MIGDGVDVLVFNAGVFLTLLTLLILGPIVVKLSMVDGSLPYDPAVAALYAEVIKLVLSLIALNRTSSLEKLFPVTDTAVAFFVPAAIYIVHNWLVYVVLEGMSPVVYQFLGQMRIFLTFTLHLIVFRKPAILQKVLGVVLLQVGVFVSLVTDDGLVVSLKSFLLTFLICAMSASAGVYTEVLLKKDTNSDLNQLNCYMYFWGIVGGLFINFIGKEHPPQRWTEGFTWLPFMAILVFAGSGLVISFIMKHFNIVVKLYAAGLALCVNVVLNSLLFKEPLTLNMALGTIVVLGATVVFYCPGSRLEQPIFIGKEEQKDEKKEKE